MRCRKCQAKYGLRGVRVGEASHPGPVDSQLDTLEERGNPPSTVPANPHALRRVVPMAEPLDSLLSGTRRLSLMSDGVPVVPLRQRDEVPPTWPASSGQLRVVHHAMDDDDTDTLVSENSRRGVVSQHESENEEEQLWERQSLASGVSDVEAAVEVEVEDSAVEVKIEVEAAQSRSARIRAASRELDGVDVPAMFARRGVVMQNVPRFLRGAFRNAVRVVLDEIKAGSFGNDEMRQKRGWKLFLLIPRMLLHRQPRGGTIAREKLVQRFERFSSGHWIELIRNCVVNEEEALQIARRRSRRQGQDGVERADQLVHLGELSSAR